MLVQITEHQIINRRQSNWYTALEEIVQDRSLVTSEEQIYDLFTYFADDYLYGREFTQL